MENRIKKYRAEIGLTQKQLAKLAGVSQAYLSEIEHGMRIPRLDIAFKIAYALETTVDGLFFFSWFKPLEKVSNFYENEIDCDLDEFANPDKR